MQRYQFELSKKENKVLKDLMQKAGIKTKRDLFNNALTLFEWAIQEIENGQIIVSMDEDTREYKQLIMPVFRNVFSNKKEGNS